MTLPAVYTFDPDRADDLSPRLGLTAIYGLFDPRDGQLRYIGKSIHPQRRYWHHIERRKEGKRAHRMNWMTTLLRLDLRPLIQIIEWVPTERWIEAEREHIAAAREAGALLVNQTPGGDGYVGYIATPEARAKISAAKKGQVISTEARAKLRAANMGKKASLQTRAKLSAAHKGHAVSATARAAISATHKGRPKSAEERAKISASLTGKTLSPETRAKMSATRKGRTRSPETRARMSAANKGRRPSPAVYTALALRYERYRTDPEAAAAYRDKQRLAHLGQTPTAEARQKQSVLFKRLWADPDWRAKVLAAQAVARARKKATTSP